jgi:putative hemolysin
MSLFRTSLIIALIFTSGSAYSGTDKGTPAPLDENKTFFQKCTKRLMEQIVLDLQIKVNSKGVPKMTVFSPTTLTGRILNTISPIFNKKLKLDELAKALYRLEKNADSGKPYFERLTDALELQGTIKGDAWKNIPKNKPVIFYANHSVPGPDVFVLANEISKVRPDLKVVTATYLAGIPGFEEVAFTVNNLNTVAGKAHNKALFPVINEHLKNGGALLIFPSGAVSKWHMPRTDYAKDIPWKSGLLKFADQSSETTMVPMFVAGQPSVDYLKIREKNQSLSKAYAFRELADKIGSTLEITAGDPILYSKLKSLSEAERLEVLRRAVYEKGEDYFKSLSPENFKELIEFASRQELEP